MIMFLNTTSTMVALSWRGLILEPFEEADEIIMQGNGSFRPRLFVMTQMSSPVLCSGEANI